MKISFAAILLMTEGLLQALPVGNPSEPSLFLEGVFWESCRWDVCDPCFIWCDAWSLRFGFAGDYVFNRYMEVKNSGVEKDIQRTQLNTNSAYLVLNFCDRVDLFGKIGETNIHIVSNATAWGAGSSLKSELGFESFLSWSGGARLMIWECGGFALGIEGEYFQTAPDVEYFVNYSDGAFTYFNDETDAFYSEWQIGGGVSYRIATSCPTMAFVPYAAIQWSSSKLEFHDFSFLIEEPTAQTLFLRNLQSRKFLGYAVGMSATLCDRIGVTVEGRFADEKALYINGEARF